MKSKKKPLLKFTAQDAGGYHVEVSGLDLGKITRGHYFIGSGVMVSAPELREIAEFMEQKSKGR